MMRCIIAQAERVEIEQILNRVDASETQLKVGLESWTNPPPLLAQCLQSAAFDAMGV
jgi:hypothetical protein